MKTADQVDRYTGSLVGVAAGDVLGAPHEGFDLSVYPTDEMIETASHPEFMTPIYEFIRSVHDEHGGIVTEVLESNGFWAQGEQTDDTAQTLCVVDSINDRGRFDMEDVTKRLVAWYDGGLGRGLGGTSALALMLAEAGVSWRECGEKAALLGTVTYRGRHNRADWPIVAKPTNGSLMRNTPMGLYFAEDPEKIDEAARDLSVVTHSFEECVAVCQLTSQLIGRLALGWNKQEALAFAIERHPQTYQTAKETVNQEFAYTGGAYTSLGIALEAFEGNNTFEDTLIAAVNPQQWSKVKKWGEGFAGPDTDTYGAITGGIAGAYYGLQQIPKRWTEKMHPVPAEQIIQKATLLHTASLKRDNY